MMNEYFFGPRVCWTVGAKLDRLVQSSFGRVVCAPAIVSVNVDAAPDLGA